MAVPGQFTNWKFEKVHSTSEVSVTCPLKITAPLITRDRYAFKIAEGSP